MSVATRVEDRTAVDVKGRLCEVGFIEHPDGTLAEEIGHGDRRAAQLVPPRV